MLIVICILIYFYLGCISIKVANCSVLYAFFEWKGFKYYSHLYLFFNFSVLTNTSFLICLYLYVQKCICEMYYNYEIFYKMDSVNICVHLFQLDGEYESSWGTWINLWSIFQYFSGFLSDVQVTETRTETRRRSSIIKTGGKVYKYISFVKNYPFYKLTCYFFQFYVLLHHNIERIFNFPTQ